MNENSLINDNNYYNILDINRNIGPQKRNKNIDYSVKHMKSISPLKENFDLTIPKQKRMNERNYNKINVFNYKNYKTFRNTYISPKNIKGRHNDINDLDEYDVKTEINSPLMIINKEKPYNNDEIIKQFQKRISFLENKIDKIQNNDYKQNLNRSSLHNYNILDNQLEKKNLENNIILGNEPNNYISKIDKNKNNNLFNENLIYGKANEMNILNIMIASNETIINLLNENKNYKNIIVNLKRKIEKLNLDNTNLKKRISNLTESAKNINKNNYLQKINDLENQIIKKNEEINQLKIKLNNLNERLSSYNSINEDLEKYRRENEELKAKINNFQNLIFNKNEKIRELTNYIKNKSIFNVTSNNSDINLVFNSYNSNQSENQEFEEQLMPSDREVQQQYEIFQKLINEQCNKNKDLSK